MNGEARMTNVEGNPNTQMMKWPLDTLFVIRILLFLRH